MKKAPIKTLPPQERLAHLLDYDPTTGALTWRTREGENAFNAQWANKSAGFVDPRGYRTVKIDHRNYLEHRIIWKLVTGEDPASQIDHRDMNPSNNAWENLRAATPSANQANTKPRGSSGLKGAHWNRFRGHWQAAIKLAGKSYRLGRFNTAEEAHVAYMQAAKDAFGEFHRAS